MEILQKYLKDTRNIKVLELEDLPIKQLNKNLVIYAFDKKSYQTTFLIEKESKIVVKKNEDGQKLKLINKGGSFTNNPFIAPKIPDDKLKEIAIAIYNDENHYNKYNRDTIYITEGLEDCLTIRQITGCEAWATCGFWNFRFDTEKVPFEICQKLTEQTCIFVLDKVDLTKKINLTNHMQIVENNKKHDIKANYIMVQHNDFKDTNDYIKANKIEELSDLLKEENALNGEQILNLFKIEEEIIVNNIGLIKETNIFVKKTKENEKILSKLGLSRFSCGEYYQVDNSKFKYKIFDNGINMMKYLECWDYFTDWQDTSTSTPFICFRNSRGEREYYKELKKSKTIGDHLIGEIFINEKNELEQVYFNETWKHILFLDNQKNIKQVKDFFFDYIFNSEIGASCHFLKDFSKEKGFAFLDGKISYNISEKLDLIKSWKNYEAWECEEWLKLYQDYILEVVCNNDPQQSIWLHNWIAAAVQDPLKEKWHCKTSLYFNSVANSTGKTLLAVNIIGMLLSGKMIENCPCNVAKMSNRDWTDKFAYQELNNKLLCVCNELGGGANFYEIIKDIIDNPTIKIEHKFKDTYKIKNTCRFIFTTNDNKLPIKEQDVRLAIFKFNTNWLNKPKMKELVRLFDTRSFNYEFCKYLFEWYSKLKIDENLIKDSYKSKERFDIIQENMSDLESLIKDIKDYNIDVFEVYKTIKYDQDHTTSYCLRDCSHLRAGFYYAKANDILQFIKKQTKIYKSTKAFSQMLINNEVEFIEMRGYRFFKIAKDESEA